ncbi:Domain X [Arachis hypogaea]|nr:Domain X [Arachis hypogaea]
MILFCCFSYSVFSIFKNHTIPGKSTNEHLSQSDKMVPGMPRSLTMLMKNNSAVNIALYHLMFGDISAKAPHMQLFSKLFQTIGCFGYFSITFVSDFLARQMKCIGRKCKFNNRYNNVIAKIHQTPLVMPPIPASTLSFSTLFTQTPKSHHHRVEQLGNIVMVCLEKGTKDRKILDLIKSALKEHPLKCVSRNDEEKEELRKVKKRRATKKRILNENEPKSDPYWLRTFFGFAPKEAAKAFEKEKTRQMDYIRYRGHFLIGIRGPREDAVEVGKKIIEFCVSTFGLRLDILKLEIEYISRGIQFLDHIICRRVIYPTLRYTGFGGNIVSEKGVGSLLLVTASMPQCIRQFRHLELVKGDKDSKPLPCTSML